MSQKPILSVKDLSVIFPDSNGGLHALGDISFQVHPREFICFLGPSGSGKTTLLRAIAGLLRPAAGQINFMHHHRPGIGMVFQQSNLMPWRTVMENIMLPLELKGAGDVKAQNKAREMIKLVGLKGFED
ncbi:MAG TPA: ATP-binding cassette domain-containing protein, partial [Anaerolineales bacterium]|nr:ATP-binding cassette domain-containing protein [Anaerolineales bacterium]